MLGPIGAPVLNFGVGKNTIIDSVFIIWPNDNFQKFVSVKVNQLLTVKMSDADSKWQYDTVADKTKTILTQTVLPEVRHQENAFSDFTVQSLLPNYLIRQGPCIQVADVNKDGVEDFFIGGAKGQPAQLFLQNKNNTFSIKPTPAFIKDAASEDVAATFFDADKDGDPDLYVAGGGFEFNENDAAYQDRLYLNDGKGNFSYVPQLKSGLNLSGNVRSLQLIHAGNTQKIIAGINDQSAILISGK